MCCRIKDVFKLLVIALGMILPAPAQFTHSNPLRIEYPGQVGGSYSIQLMDLSQHSTVSSAYMDGSGVFTFPTVPEGQYIARVIDSTGRIVTEELICFDGIQPVLHIDPPLQSPMDRPTGERVSVRQLLHPPTKDAIKAFKKAGKYSDNKQYQKAAEQLQKAVQLSPDFAQAHTNLAAQYLRLARYEESLRESQRGMEITSPNPRDLVNAALANWALGRAPAALRCAWEAIKMDKDSVGGHMVVGSLLSMHPETLAEGIQHLELVADKSPAAAQNLSKARALLAATKNDRSVTVAARSRGPIIAPLAGK